MHSSLVRSPLIVAVASFTLGAQQTTRQPTPPPQRRDTIGQPSDSAARGGAAGGGAFGGLRFRSIGPALTSGRISDIAVHPRDPKIGYVAVASGGVFKTTDGGKIWKKVRDGGTWRPL